MKSKSVLFLLTGIALGAIGSFFLTPQKTIKRKKGGAKKITKNKKAFKETASKYKEKLSSLKDEVKKSDTKSNKEKRTAPGTPTAL